MEEKWLARNGPEVDHCSRLVLLKNMDVHNVFNEVFGYLGKGIIKVQDNILLIILLLAILVVVVFLVKAKEEQFPYKKKEFLMNIPERKFFEELKKILPEKYAVFPQMQLSAVVSVSGKKSQFWQYQNKINKKRIDFVVFEMPYYKPILAIEYDGKTHLEPDRITRDELVNKIMESAGIKIFHVQHEPTINFEELKEQIRKIINNGSQKKDVP